MRYSRRSVVSTATGIGGGLLLTLLSGLYVTKPLIIDSEAIYFGFPLAWFGAGRKALLALGPWRYNFIWRGFIVDFIIYGLLTVGAVHLYLMAISAAGKKNK